MPHNEIIDYFWLNYSYSVKYCHNLIGNESIRVNKDLREYRISRLEENSNFIITLTAYNNAGKSPSSTFVTATPIAGKPNFYHYY